MAKYNLQHNLQGIDASDDASPFEGVPFVSAPFKSAPFEATPFASAMGQSVDWIAPGCPPQGSIGDGTAAQPLPELGSAPFVTAEPGGELQQHTLGEGHHAFTCTCGKGYTRLSALNRHIKEAKEPRQYECPCCENSPAFKRPGHVEQHLRSIHQVSKKATINALLGLQQAVPRKDSRRRKAAGVTAAVSPISAAAVSSSPAPFPVQGLAGLSPFPTGDLHLASTPGLFTVPDAGSAEALAGFPAPPMGYSDAGMAGSVVAPGTEATSAFAGDDVLEGLDFLDGTWFL